jgi:hypothetical protein
VQDYEKDKDKEEAESLSPHGMLLYVMPRHFSGSPGRPLTEMLGCSYHS